jgi:hypothetical protein
MNGTFLEVVEGVLDINIKRKQTLGMLKMKG